MTVSDDLRPAVVSHIESPGRFFCQLDSGSVDTVAELIGRLYADGDKYSSMLMPAELCKTGMISAFACIWLSVFDGHPFACLEN